MSRLTKESENLKTHEIIDSEDQKEKRMKESEQMDFPSDAVVKNPPANAGDTGSISGPGRSHMLRSN